MFSPLAFFAFVAMPEDQELHREYNQWHQLDHRPENLALPGVAWGDRWARPTEAKTGPAASEYQDTDYVAMYWFREPIEQSVAEWSRLASDALQWGRGTLIPGVRRTLLAYFRPLKGYAAPSALVSADALPYRPNRGLHLTLSRFEKPYSAATHDHYMWQDRTLLPSLLDIEGVAGAWTFTFSHHMPLPIPAMEQRTDVRETMRVRLVYLDGEPLGVSRAIDERTADLADKLGESAAASEEILFRTPLRTIIPWQDW